MTLPSLAWVPVAKPWLYIGNALTTKVFNPWVGLIASFVFLAVLLIPVTRFNGVKSKDWFKGFFVIFFAAWGIWILSNYAPVVKAIGSAEVGYIIALLVGIVVTNVTPLPSWLKDSAKEIISRIPKDFTIAVEDESIFIHDALVRRRMWTPEGIRPMVTVTGSHQKTCVFGTITICGKQFFRQYDDFNQYTFLKYLKELQRKFRKLMLFLDRAAQHCSSIMIRKHLEENKDVIRLEYLPKGSPGNNAVEECWRQGKDDLLVSKYYPKFPNLKCAIANYYRTKRFKLDITKYLFRNDS